ncbi:class I SAM-dependent methyltransferase, partial [Patescibacteria group bacterium]|nr:class I SAM-dependent methyltransferase [Patescibacteria group bacterium]MBU1727898.1 class I SAM-dependent methyltransferase [Patescibacteria group bacterium]
LSYLMQKYPSMLPYGVDYFSDKVDYKEIIFFNKLFFECGFENNFFDVIVSFAVFEHLHEPSLYFKESSRVLKKNGELIILVTNSESLYGKRARIEDVPRHTYHFSEKTLAKYGEKYGLTLEQVHYDDEIFDGRGMGSFRWLVSDFLKITYEDYYFKKISFLKRIFLKIASLIDKVVFSTHWEKRKKQSGIIIAKFVKRF